MARAAKSLFSFGMSGGCRMSPCSRAGQSRWRPRPSPRTRKPSSSLASSETSEPRALSLEEIPGIIADYVKAAENAKRAGFDGIEIHGANGYLIDQFLKDGTNQRTDRYGQSIENRARFALEVTDAILTVWDKSRVGIRLSPVSPANNATDSTPAATFGYLVEQLSARKLAYIHVIEGATGGPRDNVPFDFLALRKAFAGAYIANNDYTRDLAIDTLQKGQADLIAFGKLFIANPDLVERLRKNAPLNVAQTGKFLRRRGRRLHGLSDARRGGRTSRNCRTLDEPADELLQFRLEQGCQIRIGEGKGDIGGEKPELGAAIIGLAVEAHAVKALSSWQALSCRR